MILLKSFWPLMGLCYYFTWMTSEFWRRLGLIWKIMTSRFGWSGLWWTYYHSRAAKTHLSRFHHNPINFHCIFLFLFFNWNLLILQTLLNHLTFFIRFIDGSSLVSGRFIFSSPFDEFVNNAIDVWNEDVLYNWMDRASMSLSKAGGPFKASKEMHLVMVQTLINVYSKTGSYVANLFISIGMCPSSRNCFQSLHRHLSPCRQ